MKTFGLTALAGAALLALAACSPSNSGVSDQSSAPAPAAPASAAPAASSTTAYQPATPATGAVATGAPSTGAAAGGAVQARPSSGYDTRWRRSLHHHSSHDGERG